MYIPSEICEIIVDFVNPGKTFRDRVTYRSLQRVSREFYAAMNRHIVETGRWNGKIVEFDGIPREFRIKTNKYGIKKLIRRHNIRK